MSRTILGIDPGLSRCGFGLIRALGRELELVTYGVLTTDPQSPVADRLVELERDLQDLLAEYQPEELAVERVLFQTNVRTAIAVGQASGIALLVGARQGLDPQEFSPNEVKLTVTGDGTADKLAVQQMIKRILKLPKNPQPADAADALAMAVAKAWTMDVDSAGPTGKSGYELAVKKALNTTAVKS